MMGKKETRVRICPKCGKTFTGHPALSRLDNETLICPDCGTREALDSLGIDDQEKESIIETIHRNMAIRE